VLLLDEPLSALDFKLRKEMQVELKRLQSETGITFIFVTPDQEDAVTMSDRVAVMRDGLILQVGKPREIYDRPCRRFVAEFIGDINILQGRLLSTDADGAKVELDAGYQGKAGLPDSGSEPSGKISVAIRPEQLDLMSESSALTFDCSIRKRSYVGSGFDYEVILVTCEIIIMRLHNRSDVDRSCQVGDQVHLSLADGSLQILAD